MFSSTDTSSSNPDDHLGYPKSMIKPQKIELTSFQTIAAEGDTVRLLNALKKGIKPDGKSLYLALNNGHWINAQLLLLCGANLYEAYRTAEQELNDPLKLALKNLTLDPDVFVSVLYWMMASEDEGKLIELIRPQIENAMEVKPQVENFSEVILYVDNLNEPAPMLKPILKIERFAKYISGLREFAIVQQCYEVDLFLSEFKQESAENISIVKKPKRNVFDTIFRNNQIHNYSALNVSLQNLNENFKPFVKTVLARQERHLLLMTMFHFNKFCFDLACELPNEVSKLCHTFKNDYPAQEIFKKIFHKKVLGAVTLKEEDTFNIIKRTLFNDNYIHLHQLTSEYFDYLNLIPTISLRQLNNYHTTILQNLAKYFYLNLNVNVKTASNLETINLEVKAIIENYLDHTSLNNFIKTSTTIFCNNTFTDKLDKINEFYRLFKRDFNRIGFFEHRDYSDSNRAAALLFNGTLLFFGGSILVGGAIVSDYYLHQVVTIQTGIRKQLADTFDTFYPDWADPSVGRVDYCSHKLIKSPDLNKCDWSYENEHYSTVNHNCDALCDALDSHRPAVIGLGFAVGILNPLALIFGFAGLAYGLGEMCNGIADLVSEAWQGTYHRNTNLKNLPYYYLSNETNEVARKILQNNYPQPSTMQSYLNAIEAKEKLLKKTYTFRHRFLKHIPKNTANLTMEVEEKNLKVARP